MIPLKDDNPTERTPVLTYALVAANILAFLWQLRSGLEVSALRGGAIPFEVLTFQDVDLKDIVPPPFTVLTSMFLHGSWMHLGTNMLSLWIFGNNVEDALGRRRYLAFYVATGVAAALAQSLASAISGDIMVPMVGASGAIAGVFAGYLVLFPRARVLTLSIFGLLTFPASIFIGGWFVLQLYDVFFGRAPGVAVVAHVGGFVAGYFLVKVMGRRPTWRGRHLAW